MLAQQIRVNGLCSAKNLDLSTSQELQALFIKTAGIADAVRVAIKSFMEHLDFAFIYGSFARGEAIASSDVDLMLVGHLKLSDLSPFLKKVEKQLARPINPTIYTKKEFTAKLQAKDSFLKTVLNDKKIFLKGSDSELKSLIRAGVSHQNAVDRGRNPAAIIRDFRYSGFEAALM